MSPASSTPASSPLEEMPEDLADLPGFAPAPPMRDPDPLDHPPTTSPTSSTSNRDDSAFDGDADGAGRPRGSAATSGSSPGSTDRPKQPPVPKVDWRDLMPMMSTLVAMSSLLVRWVRSRRRPLPDGVWIADEEDAAAIAAPLSRIAARRSPVGGKESADLVDGLEVMVGATAYAMKNLDAEAQSPPLVVDEPPEGA